MKKTIFKSKSKFLIAVNLFLIFSLMTVSVYSWFAAQVDNRVDAYEIQVESHGALELSFDKDVWQGSLNLADLKESPDATTYVLDTIKLVEVTSDGTTFRIPQLIQKTNYAEVNTSVSFLDAAANTDYIEFKVHMRSKDNIVVYLSSDSTASPSSTTVTGENCGNKSTYASGENSFSKDCVVGALRVSFDNAADERYIWITNPEYHLNNTIGSTSYTMTTDAKSGTYSDGPSSTVYTAGEPYFWNNPFTHYYYSDNTCTKYDKTLSELPDTVTVDPTKNVTSTKLAELSGDGDENGYKYGEATFRVWIEGCDTEARRALVDGKFNLSLVFDTYGIK